MSDQNQENSDDQVIILVAYALDHSPVVYVGELESETDVINDPRFVLRRALVQMHIPHDPKSGTKRDIIWSPPMAAGKDSVIIIDRQSQPGVMVLDPDQKMLDEYRKELAKIYSGIHLL